MASLSTPNDDPERTMAQRKIIHLVEQATDNLPEAFRMVFVTRVIEGMSMDAMLEDFVDSIVAIASGQPTNNEKNDFRELAIFKSGVTL